MERKEYIDYLRLIATFAVIVLHVAASYWDKVNIKSFDWLTFNFYDSIVRWCVPIFVMISGALFLSKSISYKKLYSKYIKKILIAFFVWSSIYVIEDALLITSKGIFFNFKSPFITILKGHYHMWYLLMIIGLYMFVPILKKIVEDKNVMKYFLLLSFMFGIFIPSIFQLLKDIISNSFCLEIINTLSTNIEKMKLSLVLGYSFYFVLGYYISVTNIEKKWRIIVYICSFIGFIFTILMSSYVVFKNNMLLFNYFDNFSLNVMLEAVGIFMFFKYKNFNNSWLNNIVSKFCAYSFGIYLVHPLIIIKLDNLFKINTISFYAPVSVIVITLVTCVISLLISFILNHIPIIKKYCV